MHWSNELTFLPGHTRLPLVCGRLGFYEILQVKFDKIDMQCHTIGVELAYRGKKSTKRRQSIGNDAPAEASNRDDTSPSKL